MLILDTVTEGMKFQGVNLPLMGWGMSEDSGASIRMAIDGVDVTEGTVRYVREDVLKLFTGYGGRKTNVKPGFSNVVDMSSYKDGVHSVSITYVSSTTNEVLGEVTRKFVLKKYSSMLILDTVTEGMKFQGVNLPLMGWGMSEDSGASIRMAIDGVDVTEGTVRYVREDVLKLFTGYGGRKTNVKPGFSNVVDMSSYKDGVHSVSITYVSSITNEVLGEVTRKFVLKKYNGRIHIDYPAKYHFSKESELNIQGWFLSEFLNSDIHVFVDNIELDVTRHLRDDLYTAFPDEYGGQATNTTPGFLAKYSTSKLSVGEHAIKIYVYDNLKDVIVSKIQKFYVYDNIYFGIDVSSHQNRIDWNTVSKSGVDFAILRVGYGDNWTSQDDVQFMNNVNGVVNNHIPFGVYIYSYATNLHGNSSLNADSASIDSEIAHTLRLLNGISSAQKQYFKLPVFLDMEDDSTKFIGRSRLTQFADYYCSTIEKNGYKCGVYANKNWLTTYLDSKYLVDKYDIWLAHYTDGFYDVSDYGGGYHIWQYSSTGKLAGVNSGYLDMDVSYKKYW